MNEAVGFPVLAFGRLVAFCVRLWRRSSCDLGSYGGQREGLAMMVGNARVCLCLAKTARGAVFWGRLVWFISE